LVEIFSRHRPSRLRDMTCTSAAKCSIQTRDQPITTVKRRLRVSFKNRN
jgi:hypothetical protein